MSDVTFYTVPELRDGLLQKVNDLLAVLRVILFAVQESLDTRLFQLHVRGLKGHLSWPPRPLSVVFHLVGALQWVRPRRVGLVEKLSYLDSPIAISVGEINTTLITF